LILCVANMNGRKGIGLVLRAAALVREHSDVVIVGDGRERPQYEARCTELGLDPTHVLIGGVSDSELETLYRRADVFTSMSRQEAFGISVMKAAANGCRLVVSDIPSHREIIATLGAPGAALIADGAPPVVVADALARAIDAGPPARSVADRVPTWRESAARLATAYQQVLDN
jgi:glycosyltransferase involved in cell wall biosynthesis